MLPIQVVLKLLLFCVWPHRALDEVLVPQPGIELTHPALKARSLNSWTPREAPTVSLEVVRRTGSHRTFDQIALDS